MEIYTSEDELPEDIANDGDELVPVKDLPEEHIIQLLEWGVPVSDVITREEDATT